MKKMLRLLPCARAQLFAALLVIFSVFLPPLGGAQSLTMRRAIELALVHSSEMAMATADQMHAYQNLREARSTYIPQVTVGSGLAYSYGFPLSLEGSAPTIFNVTSQSLLLNPAQREFIRAAKTEWQASTAQSKDQRSRVLLDTALTYAELDKWEKKLETLHEQAAISHKIESAVAERIKEGIDSPRDQTKARLTTAQVHLGITQAEGAVDVLRTHLAQLTGIPVQSVNTESSSIPALPAPEVEADQDLGQRAADTSAAVKAAEQRAFAQQLRAKGEHRALLPAIDLALQYGLISTSFTNFEQFFVRGSFQKQNATFGLVIRFPFLNWTQRAHAAAADAQAVHARQEAQAAKDQVSLEAIKLHRTLRQLEAAREVAQLQSELARADLDTAEARTEAGNATLRDLQSAMLQAGERSAALLDTEFEVERVQLQLMRETGDLEKWAMSHN